jgi:hypothetical protein
MKPRILVACESSGRVRDAFAARGWDAWSCDLLPSEAAGNHIQGDVLPVLREPWDMVVAHPPCTYLTVSANGWLKDQPTRKSGALVGAARRAAVEDAVRFFMACYEANTPRVCVENPIGVMSTRFRAPDQVIQPWMFGHGETKATCFWLRGLPLLQRTHRRGDLFCAEEPTERAQRLHRLSPGPNRWKERSRTFAGVASAMADQWGEVRQIETSAKQANSSCLR